MMVAIAEAISESKPRGGRRQLRRTSVCSAVNPRFSNSSLLFVDRCSLAVDEGQDPAGYPAAAAHPRPGASAGFRGADAEHNCGELRSPPLNINGANTYQFVMSNPVGNVDPEGTQVYGVRPYISSPLEPRGPGTNYLEVAAGVWDLGFGFSQMWIGTGVGEFGGFIIAGNGVFQANNGLHQIANGFGAHWRNPFATSLWGALGAPKPVADAIGAFTGRSPEDAARAIDEAKNVKDLLGDVGRWLEAQRASEWGRTNPCYDWEISGYEV